MVIKDSTYEELKKRIEGLEKEVEEKNQVIDKFKRMEEILQRNELKLDELNSKLIESEQQFRSIFHSAHVGIAMTDNCGKYFILSNETWNKMLGYTDQEIKTLTNIDITHPDDSDITSKYSDDLLCGKIANIRTEKRYITKNNSIIWADLSVSSIRLNDGIHFFGVATDITQKKKAEFELENLAMMDSLTGLLNRRGIQPIIDKEVFRRKRFKNALSIMILDLDLFKQINDVYGHESGDVVLSGIAGIIKSSTRKTDSIARWGGEEFLLLAPDTNLTQASFVAEKIRKSIMTHHFEKLSTITVSIGVAEFQPDENFQQWYKRADRALYRAKNEGRNRVVVDRCSPETKDEMTSGTNESECTETYGFKIV